MDLVDIKKALEEGSTPNVKPPAAFTEFIQNCGLTRKDIEYINENYKYFGIPTDGLLFIQIMTPDMIRQEFIGENAAKDVNVNDVLFKLENMLKTGDFQYGKDYMETCKDSDSVKKILQEETNKGNYIDLRKVTFYAVNWDTVGKLVDMTDVNGMFRRITMARKKYRRYLEEHKEQAKKMWKIMALEDVCDTLKKEADRLREEVENTKKNSGVPDDFVIVFAGQNRK